jgi:hypothetical protein
VVPLEARLIAVPDYKSFRPPAPGTQPLKSVPSSAPAPKLRPNAPSGGASEAGSEAIAPRPSDRPLSAADEIAGMFTPSRAAGAAEATASFDASTLGARHSIARKRAAPANDPWFFRRTIVPILLTLGAVFAAWGLLLLTCGRDNALADLFPAWTPIVFFVCAIIFFALGVANALSLKNVK